MCTTKTCVFACGGGRRSRCIFTMLLVHCPWGACETHLIEFTHLNFSTILAVHSFYLKLCARFMKGVITATTKSWPTISALYGTPSWSRYFDMDACAASLSWLRCPKRPVCSSVYSLQNSMQRWQLLVNIVLRYNGNGSNRSTAAVVIYLQPNV